MNDQTTVRGVVTFIGLGMILGLAILGAAILTRVPTDTPGFTALVGIVGGLVGALGAVLASTHTSPDQPVTVKADEPLPVVETPPLAAGAVRAPRPRVRIRKPAPPKDKP